MMEIEVSNGVAFKQWRVWMSFFEELSPITASENTIFFPGQHLNQSSLMSSFLSMASSKIFQHQIILSLTQFSRCNKVLKLPAFRGSDSETALHLESRRVAVPDLCARLEDVSSEGDIGQRDIEFDLSNVDMIYWLRSLVESSNVPRYQQKDIWFLFLRLTKTVCPGVETMLPLTLCCLLPVQQAIEQPRSKDHISESNCSLLGEKKFSNKISALFYDPLAAQRAKDSSVKASFVDWTVGTVETVVAVMHNPLSVNVCFDTAHLVLEGVGHTSFKKSMTLEPYSTFVKISFQVKPLFVGTLRIIGLKVFVNNVSKIFKIDFKERLKFYFCFIAYF